MAERERVLRSDDKERITQEIERLRRELAERVRQIAEQAKCIADLERQLALRLQNSTTTSKPVYRANKAYLFWDVHGATTRRGNIPGNSQRIEGFRSGGLEAA